MGQHPPTPTPPPTRHVTTQPVRSASSIQGTKRCLATELDAESHGGIWRGAERVNPSRFVFFTP